MPRTVKLTANFMRENANFMGKLSPQQQKIWFAPFLALQDPETEYYPGKQISVSLNEIRTFIGSQQRDQNLKTAIIRAFEAFNSAYAEPVCFQPPFVLSKVERGRAYFIARNAMAFSGISRKTQYFLINLDEISSYEVNRNKISRTIPLLWYVLPHRHWDREKKFLEITFGDMQLKTALGLDKYDYLYIPNRQRKFYVDVDKYWTQEHTSDRLQFLLKEYGYTEEQIMLDHYKCVKEKTFFKRSDFEQKVLLPAIDELNHGTMVNFVLQEVWKRGPAGQKATKIKSYIGKNYVQEEREIILHNGAVINGKATNFRKLESGNQYRLLTKA